MEFRDVYLGKKLKLVRMGDRNRAEHSRWSKHFRASTSTLADTSLLAVFAACTPCFDSSDVEYRSRIS